MPRPPSPAITAAAAPVLPVSATQVTPRAQQSRSPCSAAARNWSGVVASLSSRTRRIHAGNAVSPLLPARCVSSRCVWTLTNPGINTPSKNSNDVVCGGVGTWAFGPTAAMRPSSPTKTAPSAMGGAVTGKSCPARRRSTGGGALGRDRAQPAVNRAELGRLRARVEPVHVVVGLRAERREQVSGAPVDFAGDQRVGSQPVRRRGPALVDVAHERRPGGSDEPPAARVVHNALRGVVADPRARHDLRREADVPGVGVVFGGAGLAG